MVNGALLLGMVDRIIDWFVPESNDDTPSSCDLIISFLTPSKFNGYGKVINEDPVIDVSAKPTTFQNVENVNDPNIIPVMPDPELAVMVILPVRELNENVNKNGEAPAETKLFIVVMSVLAL
jgi:hypothetical protein